MIIVLIHNTQTGQMQMATEGGEPALAITLLQQAAAMIQKQTGTIIPAGPPQPSPAPRPRNIREVITPKTIGDSL